MTDQNTDSIRIIAIFAHPDDAEVKMGGTIAKFTELGHAVKFVSLTNGDAGHQRESGAPLAKRRYEEAQEAAKRLGIDEYTIFDNHDAELLPTLEIRHQIIREIRKWNADIVVGLRPNDYHPDHRYAGTLVMDSAFLVVVPNVVPDEPALQKNPIFLYMEDGFKKPSPFEPHIVIDIDDTFDKKIDALDAHQSQFYEWLPTVTGFDEPIPEDLEKRREFLIRWLDKWNSQTDDLQAEVRESLVIWYGAERAAGIVRTESFEIAEYGYQPSEDEIRNYFPMIQKN